MSAPHLTYFNKHRVSGVGWGAEWCSAFILDQNERTFFFPSLIFCLLFLWLQKHHNSNCIYLHSWLFPNQGPLPIYFLLTWDYQRIRVLWICKWKLPALVINLLQILRGSDQEWIWNIFCVNIFSDTHRNKQTEHCLYLATWPPSCTLISLGLSFLC